MLRRFLDTQLRFLTFRSAPIRAGELGPFLGFALGITWLAGIGRYWDHPSAALWQYAGLGSVAYVFVLAAILWVVGKPLEPRAWSYREVLLFVCLTSLPALLYAIPVERFTSFSVARTMNFWFLATVATWRVALLLRHLAVAAGLGAGLAVTTALLPLATILIALSLLNLERATFDLMAGLREDGGTINDEAYGVVVGLSLWSVLLFPFLFINYVIAVAASERPAKDDPASESELHP